MTEELDTAANPDATAQAPQDDKVVNTNSDDKTAGTGKEEPAKDADVKPSDDWRVKLADGDEKELKRLSRFASEADVYKAYRELEKKKSSGELRAPLAEDASEEDLAQWRKENGIPETPDKYDLDLGGGIVIGEEDKPMVDMFTKSMHEQNASPAQVKSALKTYYGLVAQQQEAQAEQDVTFKDEAIEALREEWGADFKKNSKAVDGFLSSLPEEARAAFESARTPDGKVVGNNPDIIKWIASVAYELNPAAAVMPSSVSNPSAGIAEEIGTIEAMIGDRDSAYWKGSKAEAMQARYQELLSAKEKMRA